MRAGAGPRASARAITAAIWSVVSRSGVGRCFLPGSLVRRMPG